MTLFEQFNFVLCAEINELILSRYSLYTTQMLIDVYTTSHLDNVF